MKARDVALNVEYSNEEYSDVEKSNVEYPNGRRFPGPEQLELLTEKVATECHPNMQSDSL